MSIEEIKASIIPVVRNYPIKSIILFGSRADGTNREDSDVDLLIEFFAPVTLLTLSGLKLQLEDVLHLDVDVVHGPIRATDLLTIHKEVLLYAA